MFLGQIAGAGLMLLGFALIFVFPDIKDYQPRQMANVGILAGIFLIILGAYLLLV